MSKSAHELKLYKSLSDMLSEGLENIAKVLDGKNHYKLSGAEIEIASVLTNIGYLKYDSDKHTYHLMED